MGTGANVNRRDLSDVSVYLEHWVPGSLYRFVWFKESQKKIPEEMGRVCKEKKLEKNVVASIGCCGCVRSIWLDYAKA